MRIGWVVFVVLLASGCGARVEPSATDTNTNWLKSCRESLECGAGLECLCGRCTVRCDQSAVCEDRDADARCMPSSACEGTAVCGLSSSTPNSEHEELETLAPSESSASSETSTSESLCSQPLETYTSLGECTTAANCDTSSNTFFSNVCGCGCKVTTQCAWGVDAVLAEVGISAATARVQCGTQNSATVREVTEGFQCFSSSPADPGAEFTVNDCIDCLMPSTYVKLPGDALYRLYLEDDEHGGDDIRHAILERCQTLDLNTATRCVGAEKLYECQEHRP